MNLRVRKRRDGLDADAPPADAGFSLVEVVMTIVLMGLVLVPVMNAAITAVKASSSTRRVAELQTVLLNAADRVNRANVACTGNDAADPNNPYLVYVQAAAQTKGWPKEQASATYEWYEPGANAQTPGTWHAGQPCPAGGLSPDLVQRVTITMKSPEANISRSMQVVKSDV